LSKAFDEVGLPDLEHARMVIDEIVRWYDERRLHGALHLLRAIDYYRSDPERLLEERRNTLGETARGGVGVCSSRERTRRAFLKTLAGTSIGLGGLSMAPHSVMAQDQASAESARPNLLFVFADQWRAQNIGYLDPEVHTPHLDRFAAEGARFDNAVSALPVCTPYRAMMLTGRYALSTRMLLNDVRLPESEISIAEVLKDAGYQTGYVGKWHLDGPWRWEWTPPGPRRQGFDFWAGIDCQHRYLDAFYYRDTPEKIRIEGYEPDHQTDVAIEFLRERQMDKPFCLFLSWAPPHDPYDQVPEEFLDLYDPASITLRQNCRDERHRKQIAQYYAHITALDTCFGRLMTTLDELGLRENTVVVFTSDHGDMLGSQGRAKKQLPWEESLMVPFLLRHPGVVKAGSRIESPLNAVDIMPTLLALLGVPSPSCVEGSDLSHLLLGGSGRAPDSAFIFNICPFWSRRLAAIPEWRGVRTAHHTYVRTLAGPWLLYDNTNDPYQLTNLVEDPSTRALRDRLDREIDQWLDKTGDPFRPRQYYHEKFGFEVDEYGNTPYYRYRSDKTS